MAAGPTGRFLIVNGIPLTAGVDVPPVSSLLETTSGAYTTTRTHNRASSVLFLDRHLRRLAESARILAESGHLRYAPAPGASAIERSVRHSLRAGIPLAAREREGAGRDDEIAITALVRGADVYLHLRFYAPPVFPARGARLVVAGKGREMPTAKYSDWARVRKGMEKLRPPSVTELLLSNDGDSILEGSVTNFFVVARKVINDFSDQASCDPAITHLYEVQTAPISDGVLPGIIRQVVIEACTFMGIQLREVAPSWSDRDLWVEAFVTSSLRLLQHVETIQAPISYEGMHLKTWKEVPWVTKSFEGAGVITTQIQVDKCMQLVIIRRRSSYGQKLMGTT